MLCRLPVGIKKSSRMKGSSINRNHVRHKTLKLGCGLERQVVFDSVLLAPSCGQCYECSWTKANLPIRLYLPRYRGFWGLLRLENVLHRTSATKELYDPAAAKPWCTDRVSLGDRILFQTSFSRQKLPTQS